MSEGLDSIKEFCAGLGDEELRELQIHLAVIKVKRENEKKEVEKSASLKPKLGPWKYHEAGDQCEKDPSVEWLRNCWAREVEIIDALTAGYIEVRVDEGGEVAFVGEVAGLDGSFNTGSFISLNRAKCWVDATLREIGCYDNV